MAGTDPFNHAVNTANIWLADIGDALGTHDRHFTHRTVRSWLHSLRDRLTIGAAVKFGAQLPELLRGVYYEGWEPNRVPIKYGVDGYLQRFATEAGVLTVQAPATVAAITGALADHMSPGQMEETLAALPADLRTMMLGASMGQPATPQGEPAERAQPPIAAQDRLVRLEDQVSSLTEAVRALAHGLENGRLTGIDAANVSRAARLADEILIGAGAAD